MKLTILEHPTTITAPNFPAGLEKELEELKGELDATLKPEGYSPGGWAQINITGEDAEIMSKLVEQKFPTAITDLSEIKPQGNYIAEITGTTPRGLQTNLGFERGKFHCLIPAGNLNAQLADGKPIPLRQLIEYYCLYPGVRAAVRVSMKNPYEAEGWFSDSFLDIIADWVGAGLDRIQAFECFKNEAELAVQRAHLSRDVIAVSSLSLTTQSIVCKLGTDAVGLIPKLGRALRRQALKPFQPKKITSRCRPW